MINYETAKKYLEEGKSLICKEYFKSNNYDLEYGYCLLLEGDLSNAKKILSKIDSIRADWAIKLLAFMQGYVEKLPTYFQIRNFLEIDLNLLISAKQSDSLAYILGGADLLYSINCESYKYIARVFMNTGYFDIAKTYLDKGKNNTYNDPELHFMLCQYYIYVKEFDKALYSVNSCLEILPEYYPAIKIKESLLIK